MSLTHRSLRGEYFSKLDGTEKVYALIDSVPPPNLNPVNLYIAKRTLCGIDETGQLASGRTIYIPLGAGYEEVFTLYYSMIDDNFKEKLQNRLEESIRTDFIFSPDDGVTEYRVNFWGNNPLIFTKSAKETETCRMSLVLLDVI